MTVVPKPSPDEVARRCLKFFRHVKNLIVRGGQKVSNRCMHFCWKGVFEIAVVELNRRVGPLQHGSHHSAAMFVSRPWWVAEITEGKRDLTLFTINKNTVIWPVLGQFLLMLGLVRWVKVCQRQVKGRPETACRKNFEQRVQVTKGFVIWHFLNYCLVQIMSLWSLSIGVISFLPPWIGRQNKKLQIKCIPV